MSERRCVAGSVLRRGWCPRRRRATVCPRCRAIPDRAARPDWATSATVPRPIGSSNSWRACSANCSPPTSPDGRSVPASLGPCPADTVGTGAVFGAWRRPRRLPVCNRCRRRWAARSGRPSAAGTSNRTVVRRIIVGRRRSCRPRPAVPVPRPSVFSILFCNKIRVLLIFPEDVSLVFYYTHFFTFLHTLFQEIDATSIIF